MLEAFDHLQLNGEIELFGDKDPIVEQAGIDQMSSDVKMRYGSIATGLFIPPIHFDNKPGGL